MRVPSEAEGGRLDRYVQRLTGQPYGSVQRWIRTGQVRLNGKRVRGDARLEAGAELRVPPYREPQIASTSTEQAQAFLDKHRVYEDAHLLALNKPGGLAVQGGSGLDLHLDGILSTLKPRPLLVHRLDKPTSGLILLARAPHVSEALRQAFAARRVTKTYWALASGVPEDEAGHIDLPLRKGWQGDQERVLVDPEQGQAALTYWRRRAVYEGQAWLELEPKTGRTHQLRAHCAARGWPLVGDRKYGYAGQASPLRLHARALAFQHPVGGEGLSLTAALPQGFAATLAPFGFEEREGDAWSRV